ncbi:MAG TPA: polysaccharide deacetylase family protein [Propionibacteriaceae bacterium]|nr:polysaccharide deacetylase family protein [Propionibacteriaceae bacterium]
MRDRLPVPFVGLLLALLVLVFGSAATAGNQARSSGGALPTSIASSTPRTATDETPSTPPRGAKAPTHNRPTASTSPKRPTAPPSRSSQPQPRLKKREHATFAPPYRPNQNAKQRGIVYLTFDDGPSAYTPAILNILRATHSTATFFELGFRQAEHPAEAAQVRAEGSNVGNHTYNHPDLTALAPGEIRWQLAHGPRSRCIRPPFGATNAAVRRLLAQQGLREVLWTVDTKDWSRPGTTHIIQAASGPAVHAGSIVLLHDGGGDRSQTVAALPKIIRILQQRGYVIRRIPGC